MEINEVFVTPKLYNFDIYAEKYRSKMDTWKFLQML